MSFDLRAALDDGVPASEIAEYLAGETGFNLEAARADGIPDAEIAEHLASVFSAEPAWADRPLDEPTGYRPFETSVTQAGVRRDLADARALPTAEPSLPPSEDEGQYGLRQDGTQKGTGFLGELKRPDGGVSTEISIGVNIDGKDVEIPALVPTLTGDEVQHLLSGGEVTSAIADKAARHAAQRMRNGLSPFAQPGEGNPAAYRPLDEPTGYRPFETTMQKQEQTQSLLERQAELDEMSPSVMNEFDAPENSDRDRTPLRPEVREHLEFLWDRSTPEDRAKLEASNNFVGTVARTRSGEYEDLPDLPSMREVDNRIEVRRNQMISEGVAPDTAESVARYGGQGATDLGSIRESPDTLADKLARMTGDSEIVREAVDIAGMVTKAPLTVGKMALDPLQMIPLFGQVAEMGSDVLSDLIEYVSKRQSLELQGKSVRLSNAMRNGTMAEVTQLLLNNPDLLADVAIPSAASMLLIGAVGKGASAVRGAQYVNKVSPKALARIQQRAALDGVMYGNMALNAGAAFDQTDGPDSAKYVAALIAGAGTRLAHGLTGGGAEATIAGAVRPGSSNPVAAVGKVVGREFAQEVIEGGSEALGSQTGEIGAGTRDAYNLTEIRNQALVEGIASVGPSGVVGAATYRDPEVSRQAREEARAAHQAYQSSIDAEVRGLLSPNNAQLAAVDPVVELSARSSQAQAAISDAQTADDAVEAFVAATSASSDALNIGTLQTEEIAAQRAADADLLAQAEAAATVDPLDAQILALEETTDAQVDAQGDQAASIDPRGSIGAVPTGDELGLRGSGDPVAPAPSSRAGVAVGDAAPQPAARVTLSASGRPFKTERAAATSAKQRGPVDVVPVAVEGGWGLAPQQQTPVADTPVLQNRNRATPSSVAQMRSIASNPDYGRLGFSRDFANGSPVVAGGAIPAEQRGRQDVAVASDGRRIPVQYAVVEADAVLPSNRVDGSPNPDYGNPDVATIRAIAGNGRIAGLQSAYAGGTGAAYSAEMAQDSLHGVDPQVIAQMRAPVLVRVMPADQVTNDIGDVSNTTGNLALSPVEQANNDAQRVDLEALQFAEDGSITAETVRQFVRAMPQAEQGGLIDTNGQPTKQATDRINAAVFAKAYGNDQLVRLFAQAQDPEARNVLSALAQVAPKMARLEGAGALDIRSIVTEAAEIAVNARRDGVTLARAAQQMDMAADPDVGVILQLFADNARTVRPVVEALGRAADFAYTEATKDSVDMFGAVPRASRADVIDQLRTQDERAGQEPLEDAAGRQPDGQDAQGRGADPAGRAAPAEAQASRPAQEVTLSAAGRPFKTERAAASSARQRGLNLTPVEVEGGWGLAEPLLDTYTNEDIAQREAEQRERIEAEQRDEREAAQREQADRERDDFTLTGSDRDADVAAARGQDSLFAEQSPRGYAARRKDTQTADLFGDPYESLETRPETTEVQRQTGRDALEAARRILGPVGVRGDSASLLGSQISQDFRAEGGTTLVGKRVESAADMVAIAQVLRDPRFETFRVFYTNNDGNIVGEAAYSSRLPAAVYLPANLTSNIVRDKVRFEATGFWVLHNHPSGRAIPSEPDRKMTRTLGALAGYRGHVIIDHNEYSVLDREGNGDVTPAPELAAQDLNANPEVSNPLLGMPILGPRDAAQVAKALQVRDGYGVIVATNAPGDVQLIVEVAISELTEPRNREAELRSVARLRRAVRESGAGGNIVAVVPGDIRSPRYGWLRSVGSGVFTDVLDASGRSMAETFSGSGMGRVPFTRRERDGMRVAEQASPFAGFTREQFLGNPTITKDTNSAALQPRVLTTVATAEPEAFPVGEGLTAKYSPDGAAVFDGEQVIASYNFGDTLVVDKKHRRRGIAEELVYQWRMRNPHAKPARERTKKSQALQEKVWARIEREIQSSALNQPPIPQTETEAFKRWFGDSKVVDENGEPLVMYHGSSADISEFITTGGRGKTYGTGAFFTSSPDTANTYVVGGEGGNVTPVYVSLKNPVVVDGGGAPWNRLGPNVRVSLPAITVSDLDNERLVAELEGREVDWDASVTREARSASLSELFPDELQYDDDAFSTDDLARWARSRGYDGVVFQNVVDRGPSGRFADSEAASSPSTLAVAFRPEQIKSALGNQGTFDPSNPDIRRSESADNAGATLTREGLRDAIASRFPSLSGVVDAALRRGDDGRRGGVVVVERAEDLAGTFASKTGRSMEEASDALQMSRAQTQTPAFRRWFGDSKVVDAEGNPLVMYHGTAEDFSVFKAGVRGGAIFLSPNHEFAASYANEKGFAKAGYKDVGEPEFDGSNVMPVYVKAVKPFDYSNSSHVAAVAKRVAKTEPGGPNEAGIANGSWGIIERDSVQEAIKSLGFDGYYVEEMGVKNLAVYSPSQIKSATGNRGTFDPNNPDIRYSQNGDINGFFDPKSGLTFLVAPNLTAETAPAVLLHEATHAKQRADIDQRSLAMIEGRANAVKPVRDFLNGVQRRMEQAGEVGNAAEATAYIVEEAVLAGRREGFSAVDGKLMSWIDRKLGKRVGDIVRDFVAMVRAWANRAGAKFNPTIDDMVALSKLNLRDMARGEVGDVEGGFSRAAQTASAAFRRWFGDSKVVDANGEPLVVYHGTSTDAGVEDGGIYTFDSADNLAGWFTPSIEKATDYADRYDVGAPGESGSQVYPAFLSIKNPLVVDGEIQRTISGSPDFVDLARSLGVEIEANNNSEQVWEALNEREFVEAAISAGYDGIYAVESGEKTFAAFRPEQIKSALGNRGTFDPNNPDIRFSRARPGGFPEGRVQRGFEAVRQRLQDRFLDLKEIQKAIEDSGRTIRDEFNPYMAETLMYGKAAYRVQMFHEREIDPVLGLMRRAQIKIADLDNYLHARHAAERNAAMARRNPNEAELEQLIRDAEEELLDAEMELSQEPESGALARRVERAQAKLVALSQAKPWEGSEEDRQRLSGMSNEEAEAILKKAHGGAKATAYRKLGEAVDKITAQTRAEMALYGLESAETVEAMDAAYQHYAPLKRDMEESDLLDSMGGTGRGFSIRGSQVKRATGSLRDVENIFANLVAQREQTIVRGEKNRVAKALYGMALENPDKNLYTVVRPNMPVKQLRAELEAMGLDPATIDAMSRAPVTSTLNERTGLAETRVSPLYAGLDNAIVMRVNGEDRVILFNRESDRAVRLVRALRNEGANHEMVNVAMNTIGPVTRYISAINTQYNPVFGLTNFSRDLSGAALNLQTTPLRGKEAELLSHVPSALRGGWNWERGDRSHEWAKIYEEFLADGGATGYRDQYATIEKRARAIERDLSQSGLRNAAGFKQTMDLLSDYNQVIENSIRLAAYKTARDNGMSRAQAANLAKDITVNFNRKGAWSGPLSSLYAFFNAAVQGTERTLRVATSKNGRKVVGGLVGLGAFNAAMGMLLLGDDWDEIPEFIRARNLIIPMPWTDKKYISFPYQLGFNAFPNIGRSLVEMVAYRDRLGERSLNLLAETLDAANPLGSGTPLNMLAPSFAVPLVELSSNKNFAGRTIYSEDFSSLDPTPGHERARASTSTVFKETSRFINLLSGGDDYEPGLWSPTPEELSYAFGVVTGGLGREIDKAYSAVEAVAKGDTLPTHRIPVLSRFYGEAGGDMAIRAKYYDGLETANRAENQVKGRARDGKEYSEYIPVARMAKLGRKVQSRLSDLRDERQSATGDRKKEIDLEITRLQQLFIERLDEAKK